MRELSWPFNWIKETEAWQLLPLCLCVLICVFCVFSIGLLLLAKPLDRETTDQYRLIVTASDGYPGGVRLHPSHDITIHPFSSSLLHFYSSLLIIPSTIYRLTGKKFVYSLVFVCFCVFSLHIHYCQKLLKSVL